MDEQEREARVAALFRDAAQDAPPAGFDTGDVVRASRRITRRRRSMLAGAALAVVVVAGVGLGGGFGGGSSSEMTVASAGSAQDQAVPEAARAAAPEAASGGGAGSAGSDAGAAAGGAVAPGAAAPGPVPPAAPDSALSAAAAPSVGAPLGPGTGACADRQDPALRGLLEQVLPEVAGAPEAMVTQECRPAGERGVVLEVRDGAAAGLLSVTYLPPGTMAALKPGARSAATASGGTVIVASDADRDGGPAPFAARFDAVLAYLAPRL